MLFDFFKAQAGRVLLALGAACFGLLVFGLYLQHAVGLEPCPMCIVQRYLLVLMGIFCILSGVLRGRYTQLTFVALASVAGMLGAFVAARQSWLQWYPPEVVTCGRDLYGMIETFPLQRVLPMVFKGSGDCSKVDWVFLGGTIANWSFLWFAGVGVVCFAALVVWLFHLRAKI